MPVPAPPLVPLTWDTGAATVAASWAANCVYMHNANRGNYGENIYASTNAATPTDAITLWAAEAADYTYATNTCAAGKACGHYTQIVWRGSTAVGCASALCHTGSPFTGFGTDWTFFVCDYSPPGNYVGMKPY
jgi:hypothetical protein